MAIQTILVDGYVSVLVTPGCVDALPMNGDISSVALEAHISVCLGLMVGCVLRLQAWSHGGAMCIALDSTMIVRLCGMPESSGESNSIPRLQEYLERYKECRVLTLRISTSRSEQHSLHTHQRTHLLMTAVSHCFTPSTSPSSYAHYASYQR